MSEKTVLSRSQLLGFGGVKPLSGFVKPGVKSASTKRPRWKNERVYHGPMRLPPNIVELAAKGRLVKTSARHAAIRISDDGIVYLFRTFGGDTYLGEIVKAERGGIRVHCWSIIDCPDAQPLSELIAVHVERRDIRAEQEQAEEQLDAQQEELS